MSPGCICPGINALGNINRPVLFDNWRRRIQQCIFCVEDTLRSFAQVQGLLIHHPQSSKRKRGHKGLFLFAGGGGSPSRKLLCDISAKNTATWTEIDDRRPATPLQSRQTAPFTGQKTARCVRQGSSL